MEDIKRCPFCNSDANIASFEKNGNYYYMVSCSNSKCGIKSEAVRVGFNERFEGIRDVNVTPVMAINHVVTSWNKRTEASSRGSEKNSQKVVVRRVK